MNWTRKVTTMTHKELASEIYKVCHRTGDFLLRSGKRSNEYFDKYRFESQPKLLSAVAQQMKTMIPSDAEVIAALEMGGIPVATALSLATGIPCVFVRKKAKDYGTCLFAEGMSIQGKNLCIIEDVITSGGQVILSTNDLRNSGATVNNVLCVINRGGDEAVTKLREAKLELNSLFIRSDFPG